MMSSSPSPTPPPGPPSGDSSTADPKFHGPPKLISELVSRADFPRCALGELLNIGGAEGVVIEVQNQSIRIQFQDGASQSYNTARLRRIYGPATRPEPLDAPSRKSDSGTQRAEAEKDRTESSEPRRKVVDNPDFSKPKLGIDRAVSRPDYPECTLGEHYEIGGYSGVVVEIVGQSLKVRSREGLTRSYNSAVLRKIYGGKS